MSTRVDKIRGGCGMNGNAFIRMMREDIETRKNKVVFEEVVSVMEYVVAQHPGCEIDHKKNVDDCFKNIEEAARKSEKDGIGVVGHSQAIAIVSEYLGFTDGAAGGEGIPAAKPASRVNLEDFF